MLNVVNACLGIVVSMARPSLHTFTNCRVPTDQAVVVAINSRLSTYVVCEIVF